MDIKIKQLRAKLEKKKEALVTAVDRRKKTSKKIKISPFLFFGVTGAVVAFLLFSLVLMPGMEKKSSSSGPSSPEILRVVEAERHFNKAETQAQFNSRNITLATATGSTTGTPTGNPGPTMVVPAFRPNPFD